MKHLLELQPPFKMAAANVRKVVGFAPLGLLMTKQSDTRLALTCHLRAQYPIPQLNQLNYPKSNVRAFDFSTLLYFFIFLYLKIEIKGIDGMGKGEVDQGLLMIGLLVCFLLTLSTNQLIDMGWFI